MARGPFRSRFHISSIAFCLAVLLLGGCAGPEGEKTQLGPSTLSVRRVVVTEFQAAIRPGESSDSVVEPLSGAAFVAEPVPERAIRYMTELLVEGLVASAEPEVIPPGRAEGVYSGIVSRDLEYRLRPLEVLQQIGKALGADAVLAGTIYRWREREGTDFAVVSPASAAFDLYLIRTQDGAILWKGRFDRRQTSLSENLLDLAMFVKGRGRWMTVEQFAAIGLKRLLAQMPLGKTVESQIPEAGTEGL